MRSIEVVVVLPYLQFLEEINVIGVSEQLIELLMVSQVRSFYFAVKPGSSWLDVYVSYPQVFNMPMKPGLELVAIIGPHGVDAKGEALNHMIDKLNRRGLIVTRMDL
jgi:hypothetical protein